jgi:RIO kinase 1
MKTPKSLETLMDHGIIQEVIRPLMSGKEAQVYVVVAGGVECAAKVYKEAHQRTFKHRVEYTEGRRTRNSRDQRAASKRTRHGRKQDEAAWRNAEVDVIYRLRAGGVRVPEPINFADGVLVMELVEDGGGNPAPRLGDLTFEPDEATAIYRQLIQEVVRMLCAGVIHGDLSVFNVLMDAAGPVVIDFPQSTDPARNQSARKLLLRDVGNLHRFLERFAPDQPRLPFGEEMWSLYESNRLTAETELSGDYQAPEGETNTEEVLALIDDANLDEQIRRHGRHAVAPARESGAPKPIRQVVDLTKKATPRTGAGSREKAGRSVRPARARNQSAEASVAKNASAPGGDVAPRKRRSRRRRKTGTTPAAETTPHSTRSNAPTPIQSPPSEAPSSPRRRRGRRRRSGTRPKSDEAKPQRET